MSTRESRENLIAIYVLLVWALWDMALWHAAVVFVKLLFDCMKIILIYFLPILKINCQKKIINLRMG